MNGAPESAWFDLREHNLIKETIVITGEYPFINKAHYKSFMLEQAAIGWINAHYNLPHPIEDYRCLIGFNVSSLTPKE